jgi:hypothetical protein
MEFNDGLTVPKVGTTNENELIWLVDTDEKINTPQFVTSVMECESFKNACSKTCDGEPLRRIVVWYLLKGHFEAFGWDQKYDHNDGTVVQNVLYILSTDKQREFELDVKVHDKIIAEFAKALIKQEFITQLNTVMIPDLRCTNNLCCISEQYTDVNCVFFTGSLSLILRTVFDIQNWDARQITVDFWSFCRAKYNQFEAGLIEKLQCSVDTGDTVWICSALSATNININEVHLTTITEGLKKKIEYKWKTGWRTVNY